MKKFLMRALAVRQMAEVVGPGVSGFPAISQLPIGNELKADNYLNVANFKTYA